MFISRRRSEFVCLVDVVRGFCRVLLDCRIGALRRPTSGYNMDLHDTTPGARQRAEADQGPSYSSLLGLGSLGTAAASRVRATASPGAPAVLMSTPAASTQQPHGEGGAALSRPPASHTTQAAAGAAATNGAILVD